MASGPSEQVGHLRTPLRYLIMIIALIVLGSSRLSVCSVSIRVFKEIRTKPLGTPVEYSEPFFRPRRLPFRGHSLKITGTLCLQDQRRFSLMHPEAELRE